MFTGHQQSSCAGGFGAFGTSSSQPGTAVAAGIPTRGATTPALFGQTTAAASAPAASAGLFPAFGALASPGTGPFGQSAASTSVPFGGKAAVM